MDKQRIIYRLIRMTGKHKRFLFGALICAAAGNAALLFAPRLIGHALDLAGSGGQGLWRTLTLIGLMYLVGALCAWFTALFGNIAANRVVRDIRNALFTKLSRLPAGYFDTHAHGDIQSRFTNDVDAILDGLSQGITQLLSGCITVTMSLFFMLTLNVQVTLVVVLVTPLCFFAGFFITKYGNRKFRAQSHALGELSGYAEEMISGRKTVAAFGYEQNACNRFDALNGRLYDAGARAQFASALVNPTTRFVNNIAYVLVGVFGVISVLGGTLTAGGVASFLTYTAQFSKPFNEITAVTMQIQLAIASARRIFAVLDHQEQMPDSANPALSGVNGSVRFDGVSFSYDPNRPLIENFRLDVSAGKTIAIVGPTGAGKTTLVNLLMRYYEISGGRILIDGTDITGVTRDSLRMNFGMVLQDTWLFSGSVRDNIAYGKPDATDEEIEAAARAAHAHSFIRRMEGRYGAAISEDGGNLSQGQKQLLTIARAMLTDSPMLILDEATSSVDILTEQRIQRAFRKMMQGKTTFIIAHRLSTIRDADMILVLDRGNVVEHGTHDELLGLNGFYSRLYSSQFENAGQDSL